MAEGLVYFVVEKLSSPIIREAALLYGVRDEVNWLLSEMRWMASFLKDADVKRRNKKGGELIKNWVREVREVAQRAEDIIDTFTAKIDPRQRRTGRLVGCIKRYASLPFQLKTRHKVGTEIRSLKAKIEQIRASKERFGLVNLDGESSSSANAARSVDEALQARRRIPPSYLHEGNNVDADTVFVGFDAHKTEIIGRLLDADMPRRSVVSIVGTGGIGKTTLTVKIYNSTEIKSSFDALACVSVSQVHRLGEMLKKIAKQLNLSNEVQSMEIDDLKEKFFRFLKERRYLIVLDDVWTTDVWEMLARDVFPDMKNGSRVLLTTRSMKVATFADPVPPRLLPFLDSEQSLELFLCMVFPKNRYGESFCCPEELEDVAYELVERCGGLPLALGVLGGLLSRKQPSRAEWKRVADRMVDWAYTEDGQNCLDILALSYDELLHHHLKSCFLYLAVYPEDWDIYGNNVVELWIAEGFIPQADTSAIKKQALDYIEELAERSMIQVNWRRADGKIEYFRIHDLFHDFCRREARDDGFLDVYCSDKLPNHHTSCRVAFHNLSTDDAKDFCPLPNLRSLFSFGTELNDSEVFNGMKLMRVLYLNDLKGLSCFPKKKLKCMSRLRVLNLTRCSSLTELPSSIGYLFNLRTIDIRETAISKLPDSLGKLQKLTTLLVPEHCECPSSMGNLTNLENLWAPSARGGWLEEGLGKLVNIERLGVCGLTAAQGGVFLHSIQKMRKLFFLALQDAEVISTELLMSLWNFNHLSVLALMGPILQNIPSATNIGTSHVLFPPNIDELWLEASELEQGLMPLLEKLSNLRELYLEKRSYNGKEMVCTAGSFPSLETLQLDGLDGLEEWRIEEGAMPKLSKLLIYRCRRLRMLPEGLQHVTSLHELTIRDHRKEFRERFAPEVGDDWHKIRHVQKVVVESVGM